jgi:hypothetical protein
MVNYLHLSDRFLSATWKKYLGIAFPDVWGSSQDKKKSLEKQMARPVKSNRLFIRSPSPPPCPPHVFSTTAIIDMPPQPSGNDSRKINRITADKW